MRVLVVEDEIPLLEQLVSNLEDAGYAVDRAKDGEEGFYLGSEYPIDVAIIDLGLPNLSGIDLITKLRTAGKNFPVLILTARNRWQDKVEGLEAGGDDYMVKPFHIEELLARLKALLRRSAGWSHSVITCGPVTLNSSTQQVSVDSNELELTAYEYRVLEYLMLNAGQVVSKLQLTEHIYDQDFDRDSNVIEVFVGRLRRKLDPEDKYNPIETLRGRGYRFALAPSTNRQEG
ncbi:MAG: response regulator transcription factor [Gammaproteobacteria bacterium]|nr:response regulator transcription factor [Gammaproteobacteria bacterium]MDH5801347.1 response regulator transcription factor [Gammaproteobacteria bacterium]